MVKTIRIRVDIYYKSLKPNSFIETYTTDIFIPLIESKEKIVGYKIIKVS